MTFLEAAIEVLRHESEPLHFAEIAKRAVARNLLSHVGRDPEAAMRTCLNSAVRGDQALLVRNKPAYYGIRPGAELPPEPAAPPEPVKPEPVKPAARVEPKPEPRVEAKPEPRVEVKPEPRAEAPRPEPPRVERVEPPVEARPARAERPEPPVEARPARAPEPVASTEEEGEEGGAEEDDRGGDGGGRRKRRRGRFGVRGEAPPPQLVAVKPSRRGADTTRRSEVLQKVQQLEFEAPRGAGLDGVTDVALVMANAMSRLAEERPELRTEFENLQRAPAPSTSTSQPIRKPGPPSRPQQVSQAQQADDDDRGGRRRRRRKRRGRRVEWTGEGGGESRGGEIQTRGLLNQAAQVLGDAGSRSLHIRQIAEQLAGQGVLGGEISEIERAVTAAILLDIRQHARGSRFVARGDARYQLQTSRLPPPAAAAEQALRAAAQAVDDETNNQLVQWLQSLGPRSLEALVRMWLEREGFGLVVTLPPARGIGRLVVVDPDGEEDDRLLALILPRKTAIDATAWAGDAERNNCGGTIVFAMGEVPAEPPWGEGRTLEAPELARWLRTHGIAVNSVNIEVCVLDPTVIESISGLDT